MFTDRKTPLILVALLTGALVGCAEPPQSEIDSAGGALTAATNVEASRWASDAWQEAQAAKTAADAEIAAQGEKFALLRNYDTAKQLLVTAQEKAVAAEQAAIDNRELARQAAEEARDGAVAALDEANQALASLQACRRKPKGFASDVELLTANLDGLTSGLTTLESALGAEDFEGAKAQAESLALQATTYKTDIDAAKTKMKC